MASIENRGVDKKTGKEVWRLVAYGPDLDGNRKKYTETIKLTKDSTDSEKTKRKAQKAADKLEFKVNSKEHLEELKREQEEEKKKETFAEVTERWLSLHGDKKAPKTAFRYRQLSERLIKYLGEIPVKELNARTIEDLYLNLSQEPRQDGKPGTISQATVWHHHRLLHQILEYCVHLKLLASNPCASKYGKPAPIEEEREETFYSQQQVDKIKNYLNKEPLLNKVLGLLALDSGARAGELAAVKWSDIDFTKGTLHITKSAQYLPDRGQAKKGNFVKKPKSDRGTRLIPLSKSVLDLLGEFQAHQKEILDVDIIDSYNVFCNPEGTALHPEYGIHWWSKFIRRIAFEKVTETYWSDTHNKEMQVKICKKTDIPVYGIHALRHTCGSILLSKGYSPAAVAKRLGHKMETLMKIYTHALPDDEIKCAGGMEDIIAEEKPKEKKATGKIYHLKRRKKVSGL